MEYLRYTTSALLFPQGNCPSHVHLRPSSRSRSRLELRLTLWALVAVRLRGASCLIGIVGDVILLYNNEEKETKIKQSQKKAFNNTVHCYSIHSNTHHEQFQRFRKPMCFNVSSTGGQGWGDDSPVCWMKLPSNQAGMIVLTRRAPTKSSSWWWETFQVKAVISHFKCKCFRKYFSQFRRHKGMFTLHYVLLTSMYTHANVETGKASFSKLSLHLKIQSLVISEMMYDVNYRIAVKLSRLHIFYMLNILNVELCF